jgi:hypothetical protein
MQDSERPYQQQAAVTAQLLVACLGVDFQPAMYCRLAVEALARGGEDNVTVVVAFLRAVETTESIFANGVQKYESHAESYFGTRRAGVNYKASASKDEATDTY